MPEAARPAAFARCWTRKEAYLKGIGTGLSQDPSVSYVGTGVDPVPVGPWTMADVPSPRPDRTPPDTPRPWRCSAASLVRTRGPARGDAERAGRPMLGHEPQNRQDRPARGRLGWALTPSRIAALVIGVLALVFIFENTRQIKIRLLIPEVTMPLWLAFLAVGAIGAFCGAYLFRRRK
ncbi:4'-phosphopantetheinyl transferase superfamily protein [Streptomyces sp. M19]